MSKALVCGSFDPVTLGHLDVISRAAKVFDHVVVGVFINSEKQYTFSLETRVDMIYEACRDLGLNNVTVDSSSGYVAHYVRDNGIDVIVKGVRNASDLEYEQMLDKANKRIWEGAESVFMFTDPRYAEVSSTLVRKAIKNGDDISELVPNAVIKRINERG